MSFATEVKVELCRQDLGKGAGQVALLAGILRTGAAVSLGERGTLLTLPSDHPAVARLAFNLLVTHARGRPDVLVRRSKGRGPRFDYLFKDGRHVAALLSRIGMVPGRRLPIPKPLVRTAAGQRLFLRGVFLSTGSLSSPAKAPHLECVFHHPALADEVAGIMASRGIPALRAARRRSSVLYLKSREAIARFLTTVGAPEALFAFEDAWAIREMRDEVNRLVNAETANLQKTVEAALRQQRVVTWLKETGQLDALPRALREMAEARIRYPDASLGELGQMLGLTKSGANHRMRRLLALAEGPHPGGG